MHAFCPRCHRRFAAGVALCPDDGTAIQGDPFIGSVVDRWTLTGYLGQGAMGVVYAAEPPAAIKILHARRAMMQPDLVRRFEIEADAAMRLSSPHIARVFASGTTEDGHLYIAMELLRGEPLDAILARTPRLPPGTAATIAHHIALALEEAHARRIVHRDLKPANVFVEPEPDGGRRVRVLDFGVARINSESVARSRTGSVAGTPAYMSPEQLRGDPEIDGRSDIYSLGVLLYRMLAGLNPFLGSGGVIDTLRRHLELQPPPLPPEVPPALARVVMRLLAKPREARPQTMEDVRWMLSSTGLVSPDGDRETLAGSGFGFVAPPSPSPTPEPPTIVRVGARRIDDDWRPRVRRFDGWRIALLAGALLAAGGLVALMARDMASRDGMDPIDEPSASSDHISGDMRRRLRRAQALLAAREWQAARILFDEVVDAHPTAQQAHAGRDRALAEAQNAERMAHLRRAMDEGRWNDALVRLDELPADSVYAADGRALRPMVEREAGEVRLAHALVLVAAGRIDEAEATRRALEANPHTAGAAMRLGAALRRAGAEVPDGP